MLIRLKTTGKGIGKVYAGQWKEGCIGALRKLGEHNKKGKIYNINS